MLVFFKQNLAFISVPKTGTTAYEMALKSRADIVFTKRLKHMTVGKVHNKLAPFLDSTFGIRPERMAIMRDPVDQIRSWYKYRSPQRMGDHENSTGTMSFDEYVLDVISDTPSAAAGIGSQFQFLSVKGGLVPVHHLFAYERQPLIRDFLNDRFQDEIVIKQKNVSPMISAPISPEVERKLRAARPQEFALYEKILDADGVLRAYQD